MATPLAASKPTPAGTATHVEILAVVDDPAAKRLRIVYRLGTSQAGAFLSHGVYHHEITDAAAVLGFDGSVQVAARTDYSDLAAAFPGGLSDADALARLVADNLVEV